MAMLGVVPLVRAQVAPAPEVLVEAWLRSQTTLAAGIPRVALHEEAEWELDGPFGVRRMHTSATVEGTPGSDDWRRQLRGVEVNGRRIAPRKWGDVDAHRRGMVGPAPETAAQAIIPAYPLLRDLAPEGRTTLETFDGAAQWRVELAPRDRRQPLRRLTMWFDRDRGHLVRTRAVVQGRRRDVPFVVTTDYVRLEGLDVPRNRLIEGTAQMKRRIRTYTLLFEYHAAYRDYRLGSRP